MSAARLVRDHGATAGEHAAEVARRFDDDANEQRRREWELVTDRVRQLQRDGLRYLS
jgi:hypothetical protein